MHPRDIAPLLDSCIDIARKADVEILRIYAKHSVPCHMKEDCTPLTEADIAAHNIIHDALTALTPDIQVVSEEGAHVPQISSLFWLVDPLDGTKEFLSRNGEFTVNIALVENGIPILGVVSAPCLGAIYSGGAGLPATKSTNNEVAVPISVRGQLSAAEQIHVVGSRSHGSDSLNEWMGRVCPNAVLCNIGSSLKFCMVAEGLAHIYPRFGRTMEWDTAAGHAVLKAAGGVVSDLAGRPLTYGKPMFENPYFIAANNLGYHI